MAEDKSCLTLCQNPDKTFKPPKFSKTESLAFIEKIKRDYYVNL